MDGSSNAGELGLDGKGRWFIDLVIAVIGIAWDERAIFQGIGIVECGPSAFPIDHEEKPAR